MSALLATGWFLAGVFFSLSLIIACYAKNFIAQFIAGAAAGTVIVAMAVAQHILASQ